MGAYSLDRFQKSCGMHEPLQLRIDSSDESRGAFVKLLYHPFAVIGRDPRADVALAHEGVSRRHAYLQVIGGRVFCVDLESRTGIRWSDTAAPAGWLEPGLPVAIGPFRVELVPGSTGPTAPKDVPDPLKAPLGNELAPRFVLEALNRPSGPTALALNRCLMLVGRSPACKLRVADSSISRFDCGLLQTPDGVWVVDLLGRGGVQVGGALVRFGRLQHGDELRMGRYVFRVRCEPPAADRLQSTPMLAAPNPCLPHERPLLPDLATSFVGTVPGPPIGPMAGMPAIPPDLSAPQLGVVIQQFGQMQQQMFDHFQQAMMMLFQMFGALHRDQMSVVQEELEHIRRLSEQLAAVQSEQTAIAAPKRPDGPATTAPTMLSATATHTDRPLTRYAPTAPGSDRLAATQTRPSEEAGLFQDDGIHLVLCQRIAEIQNERQTHWQRIISLVTGN